MTGVEFGELVAGLSETVGYRRAREVVEAAVVDAGFGRREQYTVDEALAVCDHVTATHERPLSLAGRALHNRLRVRQLDRSATDAPSLFENAVDPAMEVSFTTEGAVVRRTNERFTDAFGVDSAEAAGSTLSALPVPPHDPDEVDDLLGSLRAGETLDAEVREPVPDGVPEEQVYRLRGIGAFQGTEVNSAYLVYTDITDQRRRQRELERRNEHLEAFASIVSHDLRNPLGIAKGYLELAGEEADVPYAGDIDGALDRMEEIIDEMLVLARGGQIIEDPDAVDVAGVALEAWGHVPTGEAELELGDLGLVRSDHTRLLHLFENLYRNAIEHGASGEGAITAATDADGSRPGGGPDTDGGPRAEPDTDGGETPPVTVRVWLEEDRLHVADDGPGISPEHRERALEAGYSTRNGGTGLGLFIVKEIAEAHNWSVDLGESEPGGLLVTFHGVERAADGE